MPEDDTPPVYLVGIPAVDGRDVGRIRDALEIALRGTDVAAEHIVLVDEAVEAIDRDDLRALLEADDE